MAGVPHPFGIGTAVSVRTTMGVALPGQEAVGV